MTDDIYLNEDLSKPENRINVALFGLLGHDWLRNWLLSQLDLPTEAIIYQPKNYRGIRPDFKIVSGDGRTLAWVEVELGKDPAQVANYRDILDEPVKTIWGRKLDSGDLSLEEIALYLGKRCVSSPALSQITIQIRHLIKQIDQALDEHSSSYYPRRSVSDQMWDHVFVAELTEILGSRLLDNPDEFPIGYLKADTMKDEGFSLRVNSAVSGNGELSLLNISGGRPKVIFTPKAKLLKYLPGYERQIDNHVSLLQECGLDITNCTEKSKPSLHYDRLLPKLKILAKGLLALAGPAEP